MSRRRRSRSMSGRDLRALFALALFLTFLYLLAEYWFIFIIIGAVFIVIFLDNNSKSSISKISISKSQSAVEKGSIAELEVKKLLSKYALSTDSKLFNDIIIGEFGKSTQIDHLLVTNNAIFFIETKNYGGGVFGDDTKDLWYQVIFRGSKKVKNSFLNPFLQNEHHIKRFKEEMGSIELPPLINIVCFVINEDMSKDLEIINRTKGYHLTTNENITMTIKGVDNRLQNEKSSTFAIKEWKNKIAKVVNELNNIIITDEDERANHIKRLKLKEVELLEELSE